MNQIEQLDAIDRAIKDAELRLKSIEEAVEKIDKEISILAPRKNELEQNLEFHKNPNVIPIAHEYKKSKAELSKIKARLILLSSDQKRVNHSHDETKKAIEKLKKNYSEISSASQNNVLKVLFGALRGKK